MFPHVSPESIAVILLAESLFGIGYNQLVAWAHEHHLWHVSISVAGGVAVAGALPTAAWFRADAPFWVAGMLYMACFASSGLWMVIGSTRRAVAKSHKRQSIPPSARRVRDDVVMDLSTLAGEIADRAKAGRLVAGDLPHYVHQLHQAIGALNNL